jgi:hypothetical protein
MEWDKFDIPYPSDQIPRNNRAVASHRPKVFFPQYGGAVRDQSNGIHNTNYRLSVLHRLPPAPPTPLAFNFDPA